ncbi:MULTISPECIES: flagellar export chaperone FliS [Marinobacter]|jgi:flagellar protein FliS|uniref:Flagellar secretion chaperone FliS n=3 Tax=Marinobacter TaxID=2742 RepID=A0ABX8IHP0_9GAMM|nr:MULTISPECIES: flagellar export chaperone FliS [Marinobacter]MEC7728850.1 flagellar export chaperone FliS [Pseudomonadota bacterium]ADP98132.1 flagellar protein FliS [Marinobacter adhaerens HP15]MBW4977348.1 flagellar export chaperone FliS [Marinobacter adhaerens]QTN40193.1 flagellar export chaperone FliS [Marinobacter salsuginis]QWV12159.1 flagellar export chaperone FliS [Marinobacter adhaerens]
MNGLQAYQRVNNQTSTIDADPHRLIQLLYNGAIERINMAKARMQAKDAAGKGQLIGKAIDIIGGLRSFLDFEKGGELAPRLEALYDYMERTLLQASAKNDVEKLDEVLSLLHSIKEGWDGIREEAVGQQRAG